MVHRACRALAGPGILSVILTCSACQSPPPKAPAPAEAAIAAPLAPPTQQATVAAVPLAYVNGQTVTLGMIQPALLELAGGQVLGEAVVDAMLAQRLSQAGLTLTPQAIETEKALLVETLEPQNEDEATLLLREIRRRRGLGDTRFLNLLRRNAMMRLLVQHQVNVTDDELRQAYRLHYGETYHARVLTVSTLAEASRLRALLTEGKADFADLAVKRSTDPSAIQGGLLPPISPVDPAFPQVIRDTLVRLDQAGQKLSDVVALDNGYALIHLERKTVPDHVEFADVKERLAEQVRRSAERVLMQQLARELLAEATVVVLDPALDASWQAQKKAMLGQ